MKTINIRKNLADPLDDPQGGHILTKAIIDTIQEPLVILDENLKIIAASKSFYKKFNLNFHNVKNKMFYDLGNGEWNIPALRQLLEKVIPEHKIVKSYEVKHEFIRLGPRIMFVNAREIKYNNGRKKMLISIFDATEQRRLQQNNELLIQQKDVLLREMRHRIANSLQIIASILMVKAGSVTSEETKQQLQDAHDRIMSVATVQGHLDPGSLGNKVNISKYLDKLCKSLARSMIRNRRPIFIKVIADKSEVETDEAIGLGLIVTELIINSIKHAFVRQEKGEIQVIYKSDKSHWKLTVQDNGQGMSESRMHNRKGLGSGIIDSLAKQLSAVVNIESSSKGTVVFITNSERIQ